MIGAEEERSLGGESGMAVGMIALHRVTDQRFPSAMATQPSSPYRPPLYRTGQPRTNLHEGTGSGLAPFPTLPEVVPAKRRSE